MATICAWLLFKRSRGAAESSKRIKAEALALSRLGAGYPRGPSSSSALATTCSASSGSGRCGSSLGRVGQQPQINLFRRRQNDGHRLRMNWSDDSIRFCREKAEQLMLPINWRAFGPRTPRQGVHRPANANKGRSWLSANHFGVLRGLVSAYSQNEVAGTMQRLCLPSHPRQGGLPTLRILVIGAPPNCGGPACPNAP